MKIDIASYSCQAGHSPNEDAFLVGDSVYAVADGLGGHAGGAVASARAVEAMRENCTGNYSRERVLEILNAANRAVFQLDSPARTTIAAAFVEKGVFRYAHVGDSRVYYFRGGRVIAQTKDHSVCQASVDMGLLLPEELRGNEDRPRLLKVLGVEGELDLKRDYPPIRMQCGDAFLLCSDGFWEFVYEEEMEWELQMSDSAEGWMVGMLRRHLRRARDEGDNYTVICGIAAAGKW